MTQCNSQIDLFSIGRRMVTASFVDTPLSSDIGAVLLGRIDRKHRVTERLAAVLADRREASKVQHSTVDMLRQQRAEERDARGPDVLPRVRSQSVPAPRARHGLYPDVPDAGAPRRHGPGQCSDGHAPSAATQGCGGRADHGSPRLARVECLSPFSVALASARSVAAIAPLRSSNNQITDSLQLQCAHACRTAPAMVLSSTPSSSRFPSLTTQDDKLTRQIAKATFQ